MKARHQWLMPVVLASWEAEIRRITVQDQPRTNNSQDPPISKLTRAKWTGGVAQVVEHLLYTYKVSSSNPSSIK
jgi:hypothetical protein